MRRNCRYLRTITSYVKINIIKRIISIFLPFPTMDGDHHHHHHYNFHSSIAHRTQFNWEGCSSRADPVRFANFTHIIEILLKSVHDVFFQSHDFLQISYLISEKVSDAKSDLITTKESWFQWFLHSNTCYLARLM